MQDYWVKQSADQPLFPNLLWSRPETKSQAGKLLIAGGNLHGFAAVGEAYAEAIKAGVGTARVLLPDRLQKTVGRVLEAGEYAPSTPSGSFSRQAMSEFIAMAGWADGVLLAGDFGRNSETAVLLEQLAAKYSGQLTVTKDALDYFNATPLSLLTRPQTLLVASFAQLQKLVIGAKLTAALTFEMDLLHLAEALHQLTLQYPVAIITNHSGNLFVSVGGQVSTTKTVEDDDKVWRVKTAAHASVWWLQNPSKAFGAITTSVLGG